MVPKDNSLVRCVKGFCVDFAGARKQYGRMKLGTARIIFVTGKGGVGKSTVAAGLALKEARKGRKVLLVEMGDRSFFRGFFQMERIGHKPEPLVKNLDLALWNVDGCLKDYVLHFLKVERFYKLFFENKVMRTFINVAPALSELSILGKILSGEMKVGPPLTYDLIVVDAYSTGHFLALLRAPLGMADAVKVGPMAQRSGDIYAMLTQPSICQFVVVTLAEHLPTVETIELYSKLRDEFQILPQLICNRMMESPVLRQDLASLALNSPFSPLRQYLESNLNRQRMYLEQLQSLHASVLQVPLIIDCEAKLKLVEAVGERMTK